MPKKTSAWTTSLGQNIFRVHDHSKAVHGKVSYKPRGNCNSDFQNSQTEVFETGHIVKPHFQCSELKLVLTNLTSLN